MGKTFWYILAVLLAMSLYLVLVSGDEEPRIAGTFFCNTSIPTIKLIQVLEGLLFVVIIISAYIIPVGAMKLAREYYGCRANKGVTFNDGLSEIVSMGITPIILCVLPWISLSQIFSSLPYGPNKYHAITRPSFGSLISILFWYIPFFWAPVWTVTRFINDPNRTIGFLFDHSNFFFLFSSKTENVLNIQAL